MLVICQALLFTSILCVGEIITRPSSLCGLHSRIMIAWRVGWLLFPGTCFGCFYGANAVWKTKHLAQLHCSPTFDSAVLLTVERDSKEAMRDEAWLPVVPLYAGGNVHHYHVGTVYYMHPPDRKKCIAFRGDREVERETEVAHPTQLSMIGLTFCSVI